VKSIMSELRKTKKIRLDSIIGQNIRIARESRQMSRDELAEVMELTVSHMGLIERGERGATVVTLEELARVFDVSVDSFFVEHEGMSPTILEDGYDSDGKLARQRKKISSLVTRLDEHEIGYLVDVVKGLVDLRNKPRQRHDE